MQYPAAQPAARVPGRARDRAPICMAGGSRPLAACDDRWVEYTARERRDAIRQLAELRRRLAAAEDALTEAHAAAKRAEEAYDAANDSFASAEAALDAARTERAQAREARYAARQTYQRASTAADRLERR